MYMYSQNTVKSLLLSTLSIWPSLAWLTVPLIYAHLGKKEPDGGKRRVKSARRAGKSVSFIDEKSESDAPEVAAIDLVPKEEVAVKVVSKQPISL
jgi:hypothetical protein